MNERRHGTLAGYTRDRCRCALCRAAMAYYRRRHRAGLTPKRRQTRRVFEVFHAGELVGGIHAPTIAAAKEVLAGDVLRGKFDRGCELREV